MRNLQTIEVDKWVPGEKKGTVRHAGMISPYDAFTQLRNHLEKVDMMPEEYFSMNPWEWKRDGFDETLPDYLRAECSVHWGGSEGIYMDIALLYRDEKNNLKRMDFATGKTCGSSGDDFLRMSRIAAECSMMLNGRGEIVRFYEDERAFSGKDMEQAVVSQDGPDLIDRKALFEEINKRLRMADTVGASLESRLSNTELLAILSKAPAYGNSVEENTFSKDRVSNLLGKYIEELECQEVPHMEIVELLLVDFTRAELEALGHGEFIADYFQDEHSEKSVDGLIAEAAKNNMDVKTQTAEVEVSR